MKVIDRDGGLGQAGADRAPVESRDLMAVYRMAFLRGRAMKSEASTSATVRPST
jgi:hypothetical protein